MHGPLTASEIAEDHNRPTTTPSYMHWTPQSAAARLRTAQRLNLVERDNDGFWLLTVTGRQWITVGAEG
jgi:hypothetical protein